MALQLVTDIVRYENLHIQHPDVHTIINKNKMLFLLRHKQRKQATTNNKEVNRLYAELLLSAPDAIPMSSHRPHAINNFVDGICCPYVVPNVIPMK